MLFSKNSVITVYHRSRSGRTMKLAIDASTAIAEPLKDDAGSWTVPCDIIGYNGASKGRLPKARFNLAAFEADDEDLQKAIGEALQTLVDQFIGTDWSVKVLYTAADVQELQQELISQTGEVMFHNDSVVVNWILDASVTPLVRRCSCLLSSASISVSPPAENGGAQLVRVDVNSVSAEAWLEMQFALSPECTPIRSDSSHRLTTIIPGKDSEEVAVRLTLQRFQNNNDIDSEALGIRRAVPSCASGQIYSSMNLDSIQLQISALRAEIDASIRDLTTGNAQASPRPCNIMFQNRERGCFLRVSGESPISNEDLQSVEAAVGETVPELIQPANPRPLTVNVSASSPTNVPDGKLSSPSGSIDSGISSPVAGELSPLPSPPRFSEYVQAANSRFRVRSVSECDPISLDSDDAMSTGSTAEIFDDGYQVDGLKSILKRRRAPRLGQIGAWRRTVSECEPVGRYSSEDELSCMPLVRSLTMSFDDEEDSNYLSSLEELEEEISDDLEPEAVLVEVSCQRKKSVSFSDHVHKRCFRADASILAQKKRNEKKNRCRNRRSSESIPEDLNSVPNANNTDQTVALAH